jgi:hypothetical protein
VFFPTGIYNMSSCNAVVVSKQPMPIPIPMPMPMLACTSIHKDMLHSMQYSTVLYREYCSQDYSMYST